jgi:hypothetical protein
MVAPVSVPDVEEDLMDDDIPSAGDIGETEPFFFDVGENDEEMTSSEPSTRVKVDLE